MSTINNNLNTDTVAVDLSGINTLAQLNEYLANAVPNHLDSDARRFVGDIIVEAIESNVAMSFQEIASLLSMYPRGSLRGSATSPNSLDRYLRELLQQRRLFKPARNLYIVNKDTWTEGELLQIVSKVYHKDALADVKVYGEGKHCDVSVKLEVDTYIKDFAMPSSVDMTVWVKCKSAVLRQYMDDTVLIPCSTQIDGQVRKYDVENVLKSWEHKARNAIQEDGKEAMLPLTYIDEEGAVKIREFSRVDYLDD